MSTGPSAILDFSETPYTGMLNDAFERRQGISNFSKNKHLQSKSISNKAIAIGQRLYEGAETQRENRKQLEEYHKAIKDEEFASLPFKPNTYSTGRSIRNGPLEDELIAKGKLREQKKMELAQERDRELFELCQGFKPKINHLKK